MSTYTVTQLTAEGPFDIQVVGSDGVRQTMLGFQTEADAEAWISEDRKRSSPDSPTGRFRMKWRF